MRNQLGVGVPCIPGAALQLGNSVGVGQLYCHRIHRLQLPLDMSISVTNHLTLNDLKLFYNIHEFCGSGLQTGNTGATLHGASIGKVWRAGSDSNGWDLESSGGLFPHGSVTWLGLSTGALGLVSASGLGFLSTWRFRVVR